MSEIKGKEFCIILDFDTQNNNPSQLLKSLSSVIDGFEALGKALVGAVDDDIEILSHLLDIEKGSIKLKCRDIIKNINDDTLSGIGDDIGQKIGSMLVKAKHLCVTFLSTANELTEEQRRTNYFKSIENLLKESGIYGIDTANPQRNKKQLLQIYNQMANAINQCGNSNNLCIASEYGKDTFPKQCQTINIEILKELKPTLIPKVRVKIKKPAYEGSSQWGIQYRKTCDMSIKDTDWLQKFQNAKVNCPPGSWLEVDIQETISINEEQEATGEPKYDIVKVHKVILPQETQELFLN